MEKMLMLKQPINIIDIMNLIPHRYPFLLLDRIIELDEGKYLKALKNVTINEHFFSGHFPKYPVMPGVLITEVMAQAAGMLAMLSYDKECTNNNLYVLAGIDNARFRQTVIPGDTLIIEANLIKNIRNTMFKMETKSFVNDNLVAEAQLLIAAKSDL
jgi:3-hydroxyacyl-[acyl-carrier-protein] dehydratase